MRKAAVIAALLGAIASADARAQALNQSGMPSSEISTRVKAVSTAPKMAPCDGRGSNCFRVFFRLTPSGSENVDIAFVPAETSAFVASGAVCKAKALTDFPWLNLGYKDVIRWENIKPTVAAPDKPAILPVEFNCDQPLIKGDEVTYQISMFLRVNARTDGLARYVFQQAVLT